MTEHTQRISVFLGLPTTWPTPLRRAISDTRRQVEMDGRAAHQDRAARADGDLSHALTARLVHAIRTNYFSEGL